MELQITPQQLATSFDVPETAIEALRIQAGAITINGVDDKEGYKEANEARKFIKNKRVSVEKKRVELNEGALAYQRTVNAEAKRIMSMLEPIEKELDDKIKAIDAEKERLKAEAIRAKYEKTAGRVGQLVKLEMIQIGGTYRVGEECITHDEVENLDDEIWADFVGRCEKDYTVRKEAEAKEAAEKEAKRLEAEAEAKRLAEIEAQKKAEFEAEAKRVAAELLVEREVLRIEKEKQAAERQQLADERAKLEAEKNAVPVTNEVEPVFAGFDMGKDVADTMTHTIDARVLGRDAVNKAALRLRVIDTPMAPEPSPDEWDLQTMKFDADDMINFATWSRKLEAEKITTDALADFVRSHNVILGEFEEQKK